MKKKVDINMEEERNDSFRLAENLYNSGVRPTFIYGVTRGGNYVAGPVSEYFKWRYEKEKLNLDLVIGSVVAHEYDKKNKPGEVIIEGWAPALNRISEDDTMILCDDCFDTGNTLKSLIKDIELHTMLRKGESPILMVSQLNNYDPDNLEIMIPNSKDRIKIGTNSLITLMMLHGNIRTNCPREVFAKEFFADRHLIVAAHDLKYFWGMDSDSLRFLPDVVTNIFHCIGRWEDKKGPWIQYDRYEMMGLSDDEIQKKYGVKA